MDYAVIDSSGLIVNVVVWDGQSEWSPPEGCMAVVIPDGAAADIGWTYSQGKFLAPVAP